MYQQNSNSSDRDDNHKSHGKYPVIYIHTHTLLYITQRLIPVIMKGLTVVVCLSTISWQKDSVLETYNYIQHSDSIQTNTENSINTKVLH